MMEQLLRLAPWYLGELMKYCFVEQFVAKELRYNCKLQLKPRNQYIVADVLCFSTDLGKVNLLEFDVDDSTWMPSW